MKKGDILVFSNDDFGFPRQFRCKITSIHNYNTFEEYLEKETLEKCLPGIESLENGVGIYRKYYSKKVSKRICFHRTHSVYYYLSGNGIAMFCGRAS